MVSSAATSMGIIGEGDNPSLLIHSYSISYHATPANGMLKKGNPPLFEAEGVALACFTQEQARNPVGLSWLAEVHDSHLAFAGKFKDFVLAFAVERGADVIPVLS